MSYDNYVRNTMSTPLGILYLYDNYALIICVPACSIRYPPYSDGKLADAQRLQTEGGVSRVLHLANLLTRSVFGRPRYRQSLTQSEGDSSSTADTVQEKQESNEKH